MAIPTAGRFTFGGVAEFTVALGVAGREGLVQVEVRIEHAGGISTERTNAKRRSTADGAAGSGRSAPAWAVDFHGDVSIVLRHDLLAPIPRSTPPLALPPGAALRPDGLGADLRGVVDSLAKFAPSQLEVPLGMAVLRVASGPNHVSE